MFFADYVELFCRQGAPVCLSECRYDRIGGLDIAGSFERIEALVCASRNSLP